AIADMNDMFHELLDFSKLDSGAVTPNTRDTPVGPLLERIRDAFAPAAGQKGMVFRVIGHRAWVRSDPLLLERVLRNLTANAIRYTDSGGVLVGCRRRGEALRIEVWDTGLGIPKDQLKHVFCEFFQVPGTGAELRGGVGLGLAIVERLCLLLGYGLD